MSPADQTAFLKFTAYRTNGSPRQATALSASREATIDFARTATAGESGRAAGTVPMGAADRFRDHCVGAIARCGCVTSRQPFGETRAAHSRDEGPPADQCTIGHLV
jgi:hypothetical protein